MIVELPYIRTMVATTQRTRSPDFCLVDDVFKIDIPEYSSFEAPPASWPTGLAEPNAPRTDIAPPIG
jgi:hypothetical protein